MIASVSEHQTTTWASYFFDLHLLAFLIPAGLYFCLKRRSSQESVLLERLGVSARSHGHGMTIPRLFLILYTSSSLYFAGVMVKNVFLLAPAACITGALAVSHLLSYYMARVQRKTMSVGEPKQREKRKVQDKPED